MKLSLLPRLIIITGIYLFSFIWGLSEAIFFFIIPDLLLTAIAIHSRKQAFTALFFALLGALVGGTLLYFATLDDSDAIYTQLLNVPLVSESLFIHVNQSMNHAPITTLLQSGFIGIPYKIYTFSAAIYEVPFSVFILLSLITRGCRFLITVTITSLIVRWLNHYLSERQLYLIWVALFIIIYLIYYSIMKS